MTSHKKPGELTWLCDGAPAQCTVMTFGAHCEEPFCLVHAASPARQPKSTPPTSTAKSPQFDPLFVSSQFIWHLRWWMVLMITLQQLGRIPNFKRWMYWHWRCETLFFWEGLSYDIMICSIVCPSLSYGWSLQLAPEPVSNSVKSTTTQLSFDLPLWSFVGMVEVWSSQLVQNGTDSFVFLMGSGAPLGTLCRVCFGTPFRPSRMRWRRPMGGRIRTSPGQPTLQTSASCYSWCPSTSCSLVLGFAFSNLFLSVV